MTAAIIWVYRRLPLRNCYWNSSKKFYTSVNTRCHCGLKSPSYRTPANIRKKYIAEARVPKLHEAAVMWVYLHLPLRNCFRKPIKRFWTSINARTHFVKPSLTKILIKAIYLLGYLSFPENLHEYTHKPYIARNYRVPAEDLRRWQYMSIFISFHAISFESHTVGRQSNRREHKI